MIVRAVHGVNPKAKLSDMSLVAEIAVTVF